MKQMIYDQIVEELEKVIPELCEELNLAGDILYNMPLRYQAEMMVNAYIQRIVSKKIE